MSVVILISLFLDKELRSNVLNIQKRLFNRYLVKEIK